VTTRRTEETASAVPEGAKRDAERRARWAWTEPAVWTARMLTALEEGVKGGKWFSLIDKVLSLQNLKAAFVEVRRNGGGAGVDHVTIEKFEAHLEENLRRLHEELRAETYQPQAIRRVLIPKPGSPEKRPLGIPTVRDRVVQAALRHVLEPIFEREFAAHSYGFRPNRGCKDALRRVDQLLKAGYRFVVDADLKGYFDSIPHEPLLAKVAERVSDGRVLTLVESFLHQAVMETARSWTPEAGTPQGAVISPLLSNIYLNPLDHLAEQRGYEMVRYADDFVILCQTSEEAHAALAMVAEWTQAVGLTLHPTKTRIADADTEGFDFLGYRFHKGRKWPRKKSEKKLKDAIRAQTKRTSGHSLTTVITGLNPRLRGWFEYFKHCYRTTYASLDSWIRGRLRAILRWRKGLRGRARGIDHQRWPNAFFTEQGLFSLAAAHARTAQSARR